MSKARNNTKPKTKAEFLQEAIAEAVGAGKELHLESVDFSDPNRPKTCLEVDFPILPINTIATIEGKGSGALKPVYQTMKWWARRRSTVFRQLLIAAATKAPDEETEAAKVAWDAYYGNHQKNEAFRKLNVADIFMGGGTTIVEGARLGMQMHGNDLNPVAWLVVRNELSQVDSNDVQKLLDSIEAEVKPQIMPFYACDCPRGHKGMWKHKPTGKVMGADFDPLNLNQEQRPYYEYNGPEVIYTFWAKHGPCQTSGCGHRTPIMTTPVIATKKLSIVAWTNWKCPTCNFLFDIEHRAVRLAPDETLVVSKCETPFVTLGDDASFACPSCHAKFSNAAEHALLESGRLVPMGASKRKSVELTLLIHPDWLHGQSAQSVNGDIYGGSTGDPVEQTTAWLHARSSCCKLVEFRGSLPESIKVPDCDILLVPDSSGGTVPKKSHFACAECGTVQDVLDSMTRFGKGGPFAPYAVQGYCPECYRLDECNGGKFFAACRSADAFSKAVEEWSQRSSSDLDHFWPRTPLPEGFKTTYQRIPEHGFPRFVDMFNPRQLLVLSQLLRSISSADLNKASTLVVLGVFQQYLRNQNMYCFWNQQRALEPLFSNNNYHPKPTVIENGVFSGKSRGDFTSCGAKLIESLEFNLNPWELCAIDGGSHSIKIKTDDPPLMPSSLSCGSATELAHISANTVDLVITDPPFGNNIQYSELADFFHVWLRLVLTDNSFPFKGETTPKALEAVANPVRSETPDAHFQRLLTECWREAGRILKPGGLLAFTFHHSEDEPWVAVLESLFNAGFYLEATYPIRSDDTKGEGAKPGAFGSQLIEYDIVHVCRKRMDAPEPVSWARLRRRIIQDVRQLHGIIEQHQKEGLGEADLQVIRRGKALEYYSRHYGKVYIEKGREDEFTVKDALVGINQLLDDEGDNSTDRPPESAEPYTRQFLRLFADKASLDRDQIQKYLRGTGVSPSEFVERGWCSEEKKIFTIADPLAWAQEWKGKSRRTMARDFDQAYFLIGASYEDSGIKVSDTLSSESFVPHPALGELLTWFVKHSPTEEMRAAAKRAQQLYSSWQTKNTKVTVIQRTLFDLEE